MWCNSKQSKTKKNENSGDKTHAEKDQMIESNDGDQYEWMNTINDDRSVCQIWTFIHTKL